ncbi:MAG: DUF885 family protein [Candidatus Aminicenantales bacterium]
MKAKSLISLLLILGLAAVSTAQTVPPAPPVAPSDLRPLLAPKVSEMKIVLQWYAADRDQLARYYHVPWPSRFARLKRFDLDWAAALDALKPGALSAEARKDRLALQKDIQADLKRLDADAAAAAEIGPLVPFAEEIARLEEARLRMESMDAEKTAVVLSKAIEKIGLVRAALDAASGDTSKPRALAGGKDAAGRAADTVKDLRRTLQGWFNFYNDFDPLFTWWMGQPYKQAAKDLEDYEALLRNRAAIAVPEVHAPAAAPADIVPAPAPAYAEVPDLPTLMAFPQDEMRTVLQQFRGNRGGRGGPNRGTAVPPAKDYYAGWRAALKKLDFGKLSRFGRIDYLYLRNMLDVEIRRLEQPPQAEVSRKTDASGIAGQPIGLDALNLALAGELIPYTPEQLIDLANREFAWCEAELKKASNEMGFGDDWKKAVEKVKDMHVPPGRQPDVVRDLMIQAADYLRAHDLITVPEIERETLRMEMMSPQRQLVNPFFTGGDLISVSYPAGVMTTRQKLESMRGNNIPFSHATAFHEMIPGHNMQSYFGPRYAAVRGNTGNTAFWVEGWPVYWETILYDLGFDDTPELRIGALFWRLHRCARIVFSMKFHLGQWSPQECIDYLVDAVGHERENATAEVRRSFAGGYGPLYQAAYLVGALQLRELRKEFVGSGAMTEKAFHDAIIRMGNMPIALVRLALGRQTLSPDMSLEWKCFGPDPAKN